MNCPTLRLALALIFLAATACSASAQSGALPFESWSRPSTGSVGGLKSPQEPPTFGASASSEVLRHRDFTGRPCLEVSGSARPHTINPNLYDHMISVKNNCPQRIAIQVCYYQSQDCISMDIPGDSTRDGVLGVMPAEKSFRFEFREKFSTLK